MNMKLLYVGFLLLSFFDLSVVCAQDAFFTQNYNQPTFMNPAMTGMTRQWRVTSTHRRQWTERLEGVSLGSYNTSAFSVDRFFATKGISAGMTAVYDQISFFGFKSSRVNFTTAYELAIKKTRSGANTEITNADRKNNGWRLRFGLEAGFRELRLSNPENLRFEDEIRFGFTNEQLGTGPLSTGFVPDFAVGLISLHHFDFFSSQQPIKFWWGVAAHNLNAFNRQQDLALLTGRSIYPVRFTAHGGIEWGVSKLKSSRRTNVSGDPFGVRTRGEVIRVDAIYRQQGVQSQLDVGAMVISRNIGIQAGPSGSRPRNYYRFLFGMRWRGMTFEDSGNFTNDINTLAIVAGTAISDAFLAEFSYDLPALNVGFSDVGSTFELTLRMQFPYNSLLKGPIEDKYSWEERRKYPLMNIN